ncbi:MAG: hypothetical protein AB1499_12445 [Nitrospirota bacterium]
MAPMKEKNFCYKSVAFSGGVILLFDNYKAHKDDDVKINCFNGMLFIELGDNVFLVTEQLLHQLMKTPVIFICVGAPDEYEITHAVNEIDVDREVLSQVKGALTVISKQMIH